MPKTTALAALAAAFGLAALACLPASSEEGGGLHTAATAQAPAGAGVGGAAAAGAVDPAAWAAAEIEQALAQARKRARGAAKRDLAGVAAFYKQNGYQPVWVGGGAEAVRARLARAAEDGLDPAAYSVPDAGNSAQNDVALSLAVLAFAQHAQAGRLAPRAVSPFLTHAPERPDPVDSLARVARAADPAAALDSFNPPHAGFARLKAKLSELRSAPAAETPAIGPGPVLRLGVRDERIPLVKARLEVPAGEDPQLFDEALESAVKQFQGARGLGSDGIIGDMTLAAINGPAGVSIADVLVNMERWRWLPRDLGTKHVFVNVPEFVVRVNVGGAPIYSGRVVVGTTENQTPIFSDRMSHIVVNPFWNVPKSIALNEMLPKLRSDPSYLSRRGYDLISTSSGRVVDPYSVDWSQLGPGQLPVRIRQAPGEANALGRIKFMFPNEHAVYLHDTPLKSLFAREVRAFSHGCVRLHEPLKFADAVLSDEPGLDSSKLQSMFGGRERWVGLKSQVPVHIAYFTTWVADDGTLERRPDVYRHDERMKRLLGLESAPVETRVAARDSRSSDEGATATEPSRPTRAARRTRQERRKVAQVNARPAYAYERRQNQYRSPGGRGIQTSKRERIPHPISRRTQRFSLDYFFRRP